jgi:hypothetical protein
MNRPGYVATATIMGAIALLVTTAVSAAQDVRRSPARTPATHAAAHQQPATAPAKSAAKARTKKSSAVALAGQAPADKPPAPKKEHRLIIQVNSNDPAAMNLALNNAMNVTQYYREAGEEVKIEVVTFGPGLHMLRDDTSPVKARIGTMSLSNPEISFKACGNTQANMNKAENKDIPIIPAAEVVKSGVIRIIELQEQGWTYVRP